METSHSQVPPISLILKKISDDKALVLFNSIAVTNEDKYIPLKEMNLTTKQYYTRVSGLLDAGLVKRHKGKYSLTMLGKVVYQSQTIIGKTLAYYWKLKAIESLETSASGSYIPPSEEIKQMINALIDNQQIKDILMKSIFNTTVENGSSRSRQQL